MFRTHSINEPGKQDRLASARFLADMSREARNKPDRADFDLACKLADAVFFLLVDLSVSCSDFSQKDFDRETKRLYDDPADASPCGDRGDGGTAAGQALARVA